MAADTQNDILMQLCTDDGPLPAECQTEVNSDLDDFVWDYFNGTFFEVKDFSFGMNIDDGESKNTGADGRNPQSANRQGGLSGHQTSQRNAPGTTLQDKNATQQQGSKFTRWKSATAEQLRDMKCYPVTMDDIVIKRTYDKASPLIFQQCCNSVNFKSASLIKRKDVGGNLLRGFLRLEFEDVLIKSVEWQNGTDVDETFKFIFRKVKIRYRTTSLSDRQSEAVLSELPTIEWSYDRELLNRQSPIPT
jgi:type VI protein secretion system component Hcp